MTYGKKIVINVVLPAIGILVLLSGWIYISWKRPDLFATPEATYERFIRLLEKPISRISLGGHILNSMRGCLWGWYLHGDWGLLLGF